MNINVVSAPYLNKKINVYEYFVILSNKEGNVTCFVKPKYFCELKQIIEEAKDNSESTFKKLFEQFFCQKSEQVLIQNMYRMEKAKENNINTAGVVKIDENYKKIYFNSFEKNYDDNYKQKKWEELKKKQYLYGVIIKDKIASIGFVSNIEDNMANIVIETKIMQRNQGYGSQVVAKITEELVAYGIVPSYWVRGDNLPSIRLAEKVGFEIVAKEVVVRKK